MKILIYLFLFTGLLSTAQVERLQIKGVISADLDTSLTGITVFNGSSLEGTITNKDGVFYIDVKEGDELSFKAIQFESFSLKISEKVIEEKKINLSLGTDVKELDEVNLSSTSFMIPVKRLETVDSGLEKVSLENTRIAAVDRMSYTFSDKIRQPEDYEIRNEAFNQSQPRFNMIGFSNRVNTANIAEKLDASNINKDDTVPVENNPLVLLRNKYSKDYLLSYLKLEEEDFLDFVFFAQDRGLNKEMVQEDNELELLEFLSQQVTVFKQRKKNNDE